MRWIAFLPLTYLLFVLQTTLGDFIPMWAMPHLVLSATVVAVWRLPSVEGILWASSWGILLDLAGEDRLGCHLLGCLLIASGVQAMRHNRGLSHPVLVGLSSVLLIGLELCGCEVLKAVLAGQPEPALAVLNAAAWKTAMVSAVVAAGCVAIIRGEPVAQHVRRNTEDVSNRWRMLTG